MAITATVTRGFTFATGVDVTASALNQLGEPTVTINEANVNITGGTISGLSSPIAIADGGTGSANAGAARTALGLGTIATQASNAVALTGGTISGTIMTLKSYAVQWRAIRISSRTNDLRNRWKRRCSNSRSI